MAEKELALPHLELIEEEQIDVKSLPKEIQGLMKGINMAIGRYNNKPTEKEFEAIQKQSVKISDAIQTYLEKDISDEDDAEAKRKEEEEAEAKRKEEEEAKRKEEEEAEAKRKEEEEASSKSKQPKKKGVHDPQLESAVREKLSNNEISKSELTAIIGSDNLDTWNNRETIGGLTLRKIHLSDRYRVA